MSSPGEPGVAPKRVDPAEVGETACRTLAARVLGSGGVALMPTDTVYGLVAVADRPDAVQRLASLKGRDPTTPVAILIAGMAQFEQVADPDPAARLLADRLWPGALTLVVKRASGWTVQLGGDGATVGVRCPDDERLLDLARRLGPLAATSANRTGRPPMVSPDDALHELYGSPDLVVLGDSCDRPASTVVRTSGGSAEILRLGGCTEATIRDVLTT